jgi:K+/H+ antiporter YhaU regulatory subunit KhtT
MLKVPKSLVGKTIGTSGIGARTGLSVIAVQRQGDIIPNPSADSVLEEGSELLLIGTTEQRQLFNSKYR